jgi:hypothetical protein
MSANIDITPFVNSMQKEYLPRVRAAALRGIDRFVNHVLTEAQELCPVSDVVGHAGTLKASATADEAIDLGGMITQIFGFNTSYAAAVHERLVSALGKPINHPHGQAKYLETSMMANKGNLMPFIEEEIAKEFK